MKIYLFVQLINDNQNANSVNTPYVRTMATLLPLSQYLFSMS